MDLTAVRIYGCLFSLHSVLCTKAYKGQFPLQKLARNMLAAC